MNKSFWASLIKNDGNTIFCCVVVVATCLAWITAQNNSVKISTQGIEITKTAIANQAQLEQALLLIELQQQQLATFHQRAKEIQSRTKVGGALVQEMERAAILFPADQVEDIEQTIEQSESVLNPREYQDIGN